MNKLLWILLLVGLVWGVTKFAGYYNRVKKESERDSRTEEVAAVSALPQLSPAVEQSLQQASAGGAASLKAWLDRFGPSIPEPRRSAIELDYVQLLARSDPAGARRKFQEVRAKVAADSPIYDRIKKLEKTFQ